MNRIFNNREIELLAPVKTFADFEKIIHSRADAVYFGGKNFNMRIHNQAYNLTDDEIAKAVTTAHQLGKKVYLTFNNMMNDQELAQAKSFLLFLNRIKPDALIVQDFGAVKFIQDLNLDLELHLSVMSNVHNAPMVAAAQEAGITRIVLAREVQLHEIARLVEQYPQMEYEYFAHGDMCIACGSQCYYSGLLYGNSSNRGKCMKPCRWQFKSDNADLNYPLATKDLSLYRHIPQLITSGVNTFKIEGRMRDVNYLLALIKLYADAIDRYLHDPAGYLTDEIATQSLQTQRIRNISTAYAFKKPGKVNVDPGGREPRVFSQPIDELAVLDSPVEAIKKALINEATQVAPLPELAVLVSTVDAVKSSIDSGAKIIYLAGQVFRPAAPFSLAALQEVCQLASSKGIKIYYALPTMLAERQFFELDQRVRKLQEFNITGLLVSNLGQVHHYRNWNLELVGNYGMNIYNQQAAKFYHDRGVSRITLSIEAPARVIKDFLTNNPIPTEIIVQGAPTLMYLDHCVKAASYGVSATDWCLDYCQKEAMDLVDVKGYVRRVRADQFCKNHILPMKDLCYGPVIEALVSNKVAVIRLEGATYSPKQIGELVTLYRNLISADFKREDVNVAGKVAALTGVGQSLQALNFLR